MHGAQGSAQRVKKVCCYWPCASSHPPLLQLLLILILLVIVLKELAWRLPVRLQQLLFWATLP